MSKMVFIWIAMALLLLTGCTQAEQTEPKRDYLTVGEVREKALSLGGELIRVRGKKSFLIEQTLQLCTPPRCDCNTSRGHFLLLDEGDEKGTEGLWLAESSLACRGDECYLVCTPFDPTLAERFEIVARLKIEGSIQSDNQVAINRLLLEGIDPAASRQWVDGQWVPLATGTFTITLRAP